jgi:hypothetical protein
MFRLRKKRIDYKDLSDEWAKKNSIDSIALYQFLNAYSAFCDCEVCLNVEQEMLSDKDQRAA